MVSGDPGLHGPGSHACGPAAEGDHPHTFQVSAAAEWLIGLCSSLSLSRPHRLALQSLPALSLSPTSPARPEFLTPFVIAEMDKFLTTLW